MKENSPGATDKYSLLFICISLKWILSSGQKPVCTVRMLISEQIAFAGILYFGQVFVSSVSKKGRNLLSKLMSMNTNVLSNYLQA